MSTVDELLEQTNLLHELIKIPENIDVGESTKKILKRKRINSTEKNKWNHMNRGSIENNSFDGFTLKSPTRFDTWAPGDPSDGDYVGYGNTKAKLVIDHENWEDYDRISFVIDSECDSVINPNIIFEIHNQGKQKIPDQYNREGYHVINLSNHSKKTYFLNISDLPRDVITEIDFSWEANGSYMNVPGEYSVKVEKIELQETNASVSTQGWVPDDISYSHDGYKNDENKIAVISNQSDARNFTIIDINSQKVVYKEKIKKIQNDMGTFKVLDFSELEKSGEYQIVCGNIITQSFKIGSYRNMWLNTVPKILNFIYGERCGFPIPGIHGTCHEDVVAQKDNKTISYNGGWHDAGDLSQQLIHTAEATQALFKVSENVKNIKLSKRLIEEGYWGLDFILKTDFGNGFHATSAGVSRWTDNKIGTMDDAKARVHDNSYENFLLSGILADIAQQKNLNIEMQKRTGKLAISYFEIALNKFKSIPYEKEPIMWEHTYNTSKATYNATIVIAAGRCYQLTKNGKYLSVLIEFMNRMINCQESEGITLNDKTVLKGMFYRDSEHKVFQHFNHQAREALFAQAFEMALESPISDVLHDIWHERAQDYGNYLLFLKKFTFPYPMIASGVYFENENLDTESFNKQHLLIDNDAYQEYGEQLKQGVEIAEGLYVKRFPVWFSFRGNNAVLLSTGYSAAIMGRILKNKDLMSLANGQLRWIIGNNPFDQSLMFGEGNNYQQEYSTSSGDMVGELPVGIETKDNKDVPYWPQFNNATYKEVWIVSATKWLSIVSELLK